MQAEPKLTPEQQALVAIRQLRRKLEGIEQERREPIAIVGLHCRFPGSAVNPDAYWAMLKNQESGVVEIPASRFETDHLYDPDPEAPGKTYCRSAGLLEGVADFDAEFFGISPREAICMDPQHRLLLEDAWTALEAAGINPKTLSGSDTGVFIGITTNEYAQLYGRVVGLAEASPYIIQGSALNAAAGRLSYALGLHGPSMAIDTACSSSLVAIDRACRSLREQECRLAIAGAANVIAVPESLVTASRAGMLARDGRVKAFGAGADGFVRGEGCGVVVLKRLREAEASGDRIWGVIGGSAVNQDGPSSGLTVPNGKAQQGLLRRALVNAGWEAGEVEYVEAHGTGTSLGDPIEAEAIGQVYGAGRSVGEPVWIGSVKTNLGHLEAAAGIAGLIKVVLALAHGEMPGQLHGGEGNPHIRWSEMAVRVVSEGRRWERRAGQRRRAGVSAFGFSGTNAHVLVEEAPERAAPEVAGRPLEILTITGRTARARRALVEQYAEYLSQHPEVSWGAVCQTANQGRAHWGFRVSVQAGSGAEAEEKLRRYGRGETVAGVVEGSVPAGAAVRVGWEYPGTGLGAQAAAELRAGWRVFAEAEAAAGGEAALEALWKSWGIEARTVENSTVTLRLQVPDGGVWAYLAGEVQRLDAAGVAVNWAGWENGVRQERVSLPTYPFERERFWIEAKPVEAVGAKPVEAVGARPVEAGQGKPVPEVETTGEAKSPVRAGERFLGVRLRSALETVQFETELSAGAEWVEEHRVQGRTVLPGAALLELMWAAAEEVGLRGGELREVLLLEPLEWAAGGARPVVQVLLDAVVSGPGRRARILSLAAGAWRLHAEGWLGAGDEGSGGGLTLAEARQRCTQPVERASFYAGLRARGLEFGPQFQGLQEIGRGPGEALGLVQVAPAGEGWRFYPPLLDACLQVAGALAGPATLAGEALYLPFRLGRFTRAGQPGPIVFSHVRVTSTDPATLACDVTIFDPQGAVLARLQQLQFRAVPLAVSRQTSLYSTTWEESGELATSQQSTRASWLILGDESGVAAKLAAELAARGDRCRVIASSVPGPFADWMDEEFVPDRIVHLGSLDAPGLATVKAETLTAVQSHGYSSALTLVQTISQGNYPIPTSISASTSASIAARLLFVTRGAQLVQSSKDVRSSAGAALWALRRTVALEHPELDCRALDLDPADSSRDVAAVLAAFSAEAEPELAIRHQRLFAPRLTARSSAQDSGLHRVELVPDESGLLEDLRGVCAERQTPGPEEIEMQVRATGLNFRDLLNVLNVLPQEKRALGGECSGVVVRAGERSGFVPGEAVLAFSPGWFSSYATLPSPCVVRKPESLSFAQAAGLPIAYLTALFGLQRLAQLQPGQSVLIHSAAGGLGLAALFVARAAGARIYATAGSDKKRLFLRSQGAHEVFDSRTLEFAGHIRQATGGQGVDVVLNSLAGEYIHKSLDAVRKGGCFLEVGKRGILSQEQAAALRPDVRYYAFDLGTEARQDPSLVPELLGELLLALDSKRLSPLPVSAFAFEKASDAFRLMQSAQHIGKIVVTYPDGSAISPGELRVRPDSAYLITGGLGDLGLKTASWLAAKGARYLTLLSRTAPGVETLTRIKGLEESGVAVRIALVDCADFEKTSELIRSIEAQKPLRGVVHAAGVLDDKVLERQSAASFATVARPKVDGTWNLHLLTRELPLDFFITYSSAAAVLGSAAQANYAAANATADAVMTYRRGLGLSALSVNWGPWDGAGMLSSVVINRRDTGFRPMTEQEAFTALEALAASGLTQACVLPGQNWPVYLNGRAAKRDEPFFALLADKPVVARPAGEKSFLAMLTAEAPAARPGLLLDLVKAQAARILEFAPSRPIDERVPLSEIGLDSLLSVELRNSLAKVLSLPLASSLLFDHPTAGELSEYLLEQLIPEEKSPETLPASRSYREIEGLSEEEAEALLLQELSSPRV